ncbi:MAG TPA: GTP-binding protein, partial [Ktedonobacter sp.]|nr:GTP-binding protein [Ktedonobacter sp.]
KLTSLPESLWQLTNLQLFNVGENQLTSLPESIGNLTHLHTLDLGHNELTSLPEALGHLTNLTFFLYLSNNHLTALP